MGSEGKEAEDWAGESKAWKVGGAQGDKHGSMGEKGEGGVAKGIENKGEGKGKGKGRIVWG